MSMSGTFVMLFDLTPDAYAMTLVDLIDEAEGTRVSELLREEQVMLIGPIAWQIDPDEQSPHLIGRAPAVPCLRRITHDVEAEAA